MVIIRYMIQLAYMSSAQSFVSDPKYRLHATDRDDLYAHDDDVLEPYPIWSDTPIVARQTVDLPRAFLWEVIMFSILWRGGKVGGAYFHKQPRYIGDLT